MFVGFHLSDLPLHTYHAIIFYYEFKRPNLNTVAYSVEPPEILYLFTYMIILFF